MLSSDVQHGCVPPELRVISNESPAKFTKAVSIYFDVCDILCFDGL